jgi:5-methylcytosine-specific restriction enzyme subunit McrC
MRTIRLREYEPTIEELDEGELRQLVDSELIDVRAASDGAYELRAGSTVGTAVLPDLRLLIRPKVGLRNVFFLLTYGAGLTRWREEAFPYEEDEFFDAVAWLVDAEVGRAARYGLLRDYREVEEELATVRGRIDIGRQIRLRQSQPIPLHCRYQEYGEDMELNRVVKAAVRRLLRIPGLDRELANRLRHHHRLFEEVADVDYAPSEVPGLSFNRLNEPWRTAAVLSQLLLRADSVRDATGSVEGASFTVDMNKLFERFVERVVDEEARRRGWEAAPQRMRHLTDSVTMRPDLMVRRGGVDCSVGDAKYKRLEIADWPHADLYQLLAYCVALGMPRGLLIYAEAGTHRTETVREAGIELEIVGVDLARPWREVLEQTRRAARRLIEHAERLAPAALFRAA